MNKGKREQDQEEHNPGEKNNQGKKQAEIGVKGDVAEAEGGHDGE